MESRHTHISEQVDFSPFESESLLRLHLASGTDIKKGFKGVDIVEAEGIDFVHNLNIYPWPFEDNSVFEIFSLDFVEHIDDLGKFMEECFRIMMDQAIMTILAPYYSSIKAWQNYTHKRAISELTFQYFTNGRCNFNIESTRYYFSPEWITRSDIAREWAKKHVINSVDSVEVILRAIKR